jgi:hypothetical protein
MRTSRGMMCYNMCGMCNMSGMHIYRISECDVFVMPKKR